MLNIGSVSMLLLWCLLLLQGPFSQLVTEAFSSSLHTFHPKLKTCTFSTTHQRTAHLSMRWGIKTELDEKNKVLSNGQLLRDTVPFELRGFSLPLVIFTVGILVTVSSFVGYFTSDGVNNDNAISSLGFVYGIPIFLIGLSLWYAELKPVPVYSDNTGEELWLQYSTDTLQKIKSDVTRHRYGDDAHLDSTLDALGLRLAGKKYPKLLSLAQVCYQTLCS